MSYAISKKLSLSTLNWIVVRVLAALEAVGMTDLAVRWRATKEKVAATMTAHASDEEQEAITTAKVNVCDAAWDEAVSNLSKKALFLAGGNPKAEPFASLFGLVKASEMHQYGPAKASVVATELLAKATALGNPELTASTDELAAKTEELGLAEKADAAAELKIAAHAIERTGLLREVETLIAESEAQILMRYPGRADMVRAILNPNPARRRTRKTESNETPVGPEA